VHLTAIQGLLADTDYWDLGIPKHFSSVCMNPTGGHEENGEGFNPQNFFSTSQELVWKVRPRNDVFCVEWGVKHLLDSAQLNPRNVSASGDGVAPTDD